MNNPFESSPDSRHRIALAAAAALLAAGLVLVMFVLPAEYGVDPLGTGARFGLLELGLTGQRVEALEAAAGTATGGGQPIVVPQERAFKEETVEFRLAPGEWVEYKYRLEQGEALLYSWQATAPVNVEFHAEPDGGPRGYAQTYEKGSGTSAAAGTLNAPFPGIHGWWWENATGQEVTVTLTSAGFYNLAHEFREGAPVRNKTF
jgi:hypothetical protein